MVSGSVALALFVSLFIFRYVRLVVSIPANILYRPYPVATPPTYTGRDVTVVVPTTFKNPAELLQCLKNIGHSSPASTIVVTSFNNTPRVRELCALSSFRRIQVLGVEKLNKRHQLLTALEQTKTEIVVFVDDDVFWPDGYLVHLLAIFEKPKVGAGGTCQRVRRNSIPNVWNFLGISYLERRVWNNITTQAIDGSISTLSGRTAAYRSKILKSSEFVHFFTHDQWLGRRLNSDDDKCFTRYVYSRGWEIALQTSTAIETTMEDNSKYIEQCKRWARAHWRGNFTVMTSETYWYSPRYLWGFYVIYLGQFQTPALLVEGLLFWLLEMGLRDRSASIKQRAFIALGCWILFAKVVKLTPHFCRYPADVVFLPVAVLFGYSHGLINIYSLCTLHVTSWGSQQLAQLERAKAEKAEVVPLLRTTIEEATYHEPTPGNLMEGDDYFTARPAET